MTRDEALRLLGLDEEATEADIKLAYRELAQILHPDKYNNNKRLSDRANEQLKMVNEAREVLLGKRGSSGKGGAAGKGGASGKGKSSGSHASKTDRVSANKARLAGILAAITQLTAQLHAEMGRRRTGIYLTAGGVIGFILGEFFMMRMIAPFAATALIWGAIQIFSTQANIKTLRKYLKELEKERKRYEKELQDL